MSTIEALKVPMTLAFRASVEGDYETVRQFLELAQRAGNRAERKFEEVLQ